MLRFLNGQGWKVKSQVHGLDEAQEGLMLGLCSDHIRNVSNQHFWVVSRAIAHFCFFFPVVFLFFTFSFSPLSKPPISFPILDALLTSLFYNLVTSLTSSLGIGPHLSGLHILAISLIPPPLWFCSTSSQVSIYGHQTATALLQLVFPGFGHKLLHGLISSAERVLQESFGMWTSSRICLSSLLCTLLLCPFHGEGHHRDPEMPSRHFCNGIITLFSGKASHRLIPRCDVSHLRWCCPLPVKSTHPSPAFICIQVAAVEQRMQSHHFNQACLETCPRPGLSRQLHFPRRTTPVKSVVWPWEVFFAWLSMKKHNTTTKSSSIESVWNYFISVQTFKNTRSSTWKRSPSEIT